MTAWLIINESMKNNRFEEIYGMLIEGAKKNQVYLKEYTNAELLSKLIIVDGEEVLDISKRPEFVLFWDKDVVLASLLEKLGLKVYNSARSIRICDNKALTVKALLHKNIKMPKTFFSPLVFYVDGVIPSYFWNSVIEELSFPFVIKECYGSFGEQVYLIQNEVELPKYIEFLKNRPFIVQEYIESSKGRDVRIYTVNKKAVASIIRTNDEDFRANFGAGARANAYTPAADFIKMAEDISKYLNLDFGGIDLLFDKEERPVFCEANSNAHFRKLADSTGIDIGDEIIRMCIKDNGKIKRVVDL